MDKYMTLSTTLDMIKVLLLTIGVMGFCRTKRKRYIVIYCIVFCVGVTCALRGVIGTLYVDTFLYFATVFLILQGSWKEKIKLAIFSVLVISLVDILTGTMLSVLIHVDIEQIHRSDDLCICVSIIAFALWGVFTILLRKKKKYIYELWQGLGTKRHVLTLLTLFSLACSNTAVQDALYSTASNGSKMAGMFMLGVSLVMIIILGGYYLSLFEKNKQLTMLDTMYRRNLEWERRYFENMKEKNEELRRFRHDIVHQVSVLRSYNQEGNQEKINTYLDKMLGQINQMKSIHSGNYISDVLLNQIIAEDVERRKYEFQLIGKFPTDIVLADNDFAVLLGNLLVNAKEGVERYKAENKQICLKVKNYERQLFLTLENSCDIECAETVSGKTSKKDKDNHGYGVQMIEYIVEKYHGCIEKKIEDDKYLVEISI